LFFVLSVGLPGREKSISTPFSYAHLPSTFKNNPLPLSALI
jgi:hypothetical protein